MADEETNSLSQIPGEDGISTRGWALALPGPITTRDEFRDINNLVNAVGARNPVTAPASTRSLADPAGDIPFTFSYRIKKQTNHTYCGCLRSQSPAKNSYLIGWSTDTTWLSGTQKCNKSNRLVRSRNRCTASPGYSWISHLCVKWCTCLHVISTCALIIPSPHVCYI